MFTCSVSSHGTEVQRQQREGRHNTTTQLHHNLITFCLVTTTTTIGTAFCDQVMLCTLVLGFGALGLNHSDSDTNNILVPEPEKDKIKLLVKLLL